MAGILIDIQHSAKAFARAPSFALGLLLSIALGIGSNVVVHGFIRGLVARDSPLTAVGRIVSLFGQDAGGAAALVSYEDFVAIKKEPRFEWVGAASEFQSVIQLSDLPDVLTVAAVTPDLAGPLTLSLKDGVVISHRVWINQFKARSDVRGERIRIDGVETRVDGVAPDWLDGLYVGRPIDIWMPLREESLQGVQRSARSLWVLGRLRPDDDSSQKRILLRSASTKSGQIYANPYTRITPGMAKGLAQIDRVLGIATGLVFFIACGNVASFLLGRASARGHETSIRVALGAGRGQLVRELLADSIFISLTGGVLGTLLAVWTSQIIPALFFEQDAESLVSAPDVYSFIASSAACIGITIICGLVPLFEIQHDRPAAVLRREHAGPSRAIRRLRTALVMAQMTCCCVLMICAGLLFEGLQREFETSAGQRLGQAMFAIIDARDFKYFQDVEQAAQSLAGISGTAWAARLPGNRPMWQSLRVDPPPLAFRDVTIDAETFTAHSRPLFTLPPRAGRMFGGRDTAQTCRVALLNEEAAEELFEGDAVGRAIEDSKGERVDIVGIVTSRRSERRLQSRPTIYFYGDQDLSDDPTGPQHFRVPVPEPASKAVLDANIVSQSYFDTMGLSFIAKRPESTALHNQRCRVGVVNSEAAELYFGGNAIGASVVDDIGRRTEIIGVVQSTPLGTFQPRVEPTIYFQMDSDSPAQMTLILRSRQASPAMLDAVRSRVESVPGGGPAPVVKTLETHFAQTALAPLRIATVLVSLSAGMALVLGIMGVYGALTDAARQRNRELAVRVALGAQCRHIVFQVLIEGGRLAAAGTVAGMLGSLVISRFLSQMSGASRPWVWLAAPLLLFVAVAVAGILPARRALMVDPLQIMRDN